MLLRPLDTRAVDDVIPALALRGYEGRHRRRRGRFGPNAEEGEFGLEGATTLAFMFESRFPQKLTRYAAELAERDDDYAECWTGLESRFDPQRP